MLHSELIPASTPNSKRLLIMLHGLGDSITGYVWMPELMNLPWLNYLLVNAPDPYYGGYSWYDFTGDMIPGVHRSRKLLFDLLDTQRQNGFPSEQTILGGFSQGCLMSLDAGLRYPHQLAGILGISGYVCEPQTLLQELSPVGLQIPVLMTHGTLDPLVPMGEVRKQVQQLKAAGLKIDWHEFVKAHTIAGELELKVIRDFTRRCFEKPDTGC
jgi:phospholipase/carboxylesterase